MTQEISDSGCNLSDRLEWMKPIFKNWVQHNETFHEFHAKYDDSLFFYRERPSVGTLAAAAWSVTNGYAVQEYYSEKKKEASDNKKTNDEKDTKYGREDLYLGIGDKHAIRLEAKFDFVNAYSELQSGSFHETIKNCISLARKDTKKIIEGDRCVALAIVHFHSLDKNTNNDLIARTAEAIKEIKTEAKAWYFIRPGVSGDYDHTYFGSALFISPRLRKKNDAPE